MRTLLTCSLVIMTASTAFAQEADPLVEKVRKSIDRGVNYLKLQERGTGNWASTSGTKLSYPGGRSSLAMLALLNSGVSPKDPIIQRGLKSLRALPNAQTYVVGLATMVFAQAGEPVDRERVQENVDWLLSGRKPDGWGYTQRSPVADNSNTQYALLGLHEGIRAGAKVSDKDIKSIQDFYLRTQRDDGGWKYRDGHPPTVTMTTAGVCGLMITGMDLAKGQQQLQPSGVAIRCGEYSENEPVAKGLDWLGRRFPPTWTPERISVLGTTFYSLYGIERAGRLSGQRFIGGHDWYRLGCDYLVSTQLANGSWKQSTRNAKGAAHDPVISTAFSLLFLSKGRTPVLITKFAHGPEDDWNRKRHDVRNVVEFASKELFKGMPLAWQIFDVRELKTIDENELRRQLVEELLPSPILYLNGHYLRMSDREKQVLREYLNNGGFLFAEACCGSVRFDADFRGLMEDLYGDEDIELKPLPKDHPIWTASGKFRVPPNDPFPLYGIQYGCKWVAVYSPRPLAGFWEENQYAGGTGKIAFELAANVIAYATGLIPPRPRLTTVKVPPPEISKEKIKRGYVEIGQLAHDGDWRPAPRAMRNLMEELRKTGADVILSTSRVRLSSSVFLDTQEKNSPIRSVADLYLFYLHGRREFRADAKVLDDLRFRLEVGGTLLADACCGSKSFDKAFRKAMSEMWTEENLKLEPIPLDDLLFSKELNGEPIDNVHCRRPVAKGALPELQVVPPALEGIKYKGRWVVIYSKYDLGCALEGHSSSDCLGHDHESALRLGRAAILHALKP